MASTGPGRTICTLVRADGRANPLSIVNEARRDGDGLARTPALEFERQRTAAVRPDQLDYPLAADITLAVDRDDDIERPQAGLVGRRASDHSQNCGRVTGCTPMSPSSDLPTAAGTSVTRSLRPFRSIRELDLALRQRENRRQEALPRGDLDAVDGDDAIAGLNAGRLGHGPLGKIDDDRFAVERRNLDAVVQHERQHDDGERQIHHRPHDEHLEALPFRLRQELVGRAGRPVVRILAGHLHVAAERDGAHAGPGVPPVDSATSGPNPSENVSTRTPIRRAIRK